ncbi:unnamed protein product [Pylaiella littoralis]
MSPSTSTSTTFSTAAASVAVLTGMLTAAEALRVLTPWNGMTVVADRPVMTSWGGSGASPDDRFEIDLHYCGSYSFCFENDYDCGFLIANLCSNDGDSACMSQEEMSSQVVFPEPMNGVSNDGYRVRISEVGSETFRCSDDFYLMSSADAPAAGEPGGPTVEVLAPDANSMALAGEMYTVEFGYDNGFGVSMGRFNIDLYEAQGPGDCGAYVTSICDKPGMGCHDTQGDYDIVIPQDTAVGMYKIRVGLFGADDVYGCSEAFEVVRSDLSMDLVAL